MWPAMRALPESLKHSIKSGQYKADHGYATYVSCLRKPCSFFIWRESQNPDDSVVTLEDVHADKLCTLRSTVNLVLQEILSLAIVR